MSSSLQAFLAAREHQEHLVHGGFVQEYPATFEDWAATTGTAGSQKEESCPPSSR